MARIAAKDGGTRQRDTPDPGKLDPGDRGKPLARHGRRAFPVRTITRSRYVTPGGLPTLFGASVRSAG